MLRCERAYFFNVLIDVQPHAFNGWLLKENRFQTHSFHLCLRTSQLGTPHFERQRCLMLVLVVNVSLASNVCRYSQHEHDIYSVLIVSCHCVRVLRRLEVPSLLETVTRRIHCPNRSY